MGSNIIERTKFYEEISKCSIDYSPPAQYFTDVLDSLEDMQKQINDLRQDNERMRKELNKIFK
jgi:HAMP domain-containing protein